MGILAAVNQNFGVELAGGVRDVLATYWPLILIACAAGFWFTTGSWKDVWKKWGPKRNPVVPVNPLVPPVPVVVDPTVTAYLEARAKKVASRDAHLASAATIDLEIANDDAVIEGVAQ